MKFLIQLYIYAQSVVETISVRASKPTMDAIAEAERDIAAGRVVEYTNWGCGL